MSILYFILVNCSRLLLCICYIDLVCIKDLHITVLIKKIISWLWLLNDDRIRKSKQIGNNDNCIESMNGDLNKNQCFTSVSIIMMRSLVTTLCNAIRYMKINSKQVSNNCIILLVFATMMFNIFLLIELNSNE